jgi:hypothetical protein
VTASAPAHAAVDDGERIRPGRIGQPVNTTSSLAFVMAGLAMGRRARRRDPAWPWVAVAGATALVGVGSVGFHGPGNRPGKALHDLGVAAVAVTLPLALALDPPARFPRAAAALGAVAVLLHTQSRTGGHLAGTGAPVPGHSVFHLVAAAALACVVPGDDSEVRDSIRWCR